MSTTLHVAVLVYPGVEVVDMNGPIDVFVKATGEKKTTYKVYTVAETTAPIVSENSAVHIVPGYTLANCPQPDIVVIPGQIMPAGSPQPFGQGSPAVISWLQKQAAQPKTTIMSVCIGAYILANTGLLNGKKATTHWEAIKTFQQQYPAISLVKNVRYVADGRFMTTGGVTSGIDGALALVASIDGPKIAQAVANTMVYTLDAPLPPGTILP